MNIMFRVWDEISKTMTYPNEGSYCITMIGSVCDDETDGGGTLENRSYRAKAMQYTGLKDMDGVTEVYEGDIISADGLIIGNQHENPEILETGTNLLIQGFGSEAWIDAHKKAMERGCKYA